MVIVKKEQKFCVLIGMNLNWKIDFRKVKERFISPEFIILIFVFFFAQ